MRVAGAAAVVLLAAWAFLAGVNVEQGDWLMASLCLTVVVGHGGMLVRVLGGDR